MSEVWLGDIRLRNRLVTSSSLLGYGAADSGLVPYGMSPISRFVPLERFGAVTIRTLTVQPRDGHFTNRTDWPLRALPGLLRRYATVLRRADAGWINAFGWCNIGIDAYLRDYYPCTRDQNTIISVGGFTAEEFVCLVDAVNAAVPSGEIAAVEFNVSCPNINHDFEPILDGVLVDGAPQQAPGDPQAVAGSGLRRARPAGWRRRGLGAHGDQHGARAAAGPADRDTLAGQPAMAGCPAGR